MIEESEKQCSLERVKAPRRIPENVPTSTRGRILGRPPEPEPLSTEEQRRLRREWWLRVPLAIIAPRLVFTALRDERQVALAARQEPVLLLVPVLA